MSSREPTAVLTHHWLVRRRGGEKVLEALAELLPSAAIHTLVLDREGMRSSPLLAREIRPSRLARLPGAARFYPQLLPLLPTFARQVALPEVDLVLCSDAAMAKAMRPAPGSTVVCYCHSPMRYAYEEELFWEYRASVPRLVRPLFDAAIRHARSVDQHAAKRVDVFVANSAHVAERIERVYQRTARIVHPPVDLPDAPSTEPRDDYFLCVGHHTPYKRLDLAVEATRRLGRRLVVVGTGSEVARLERDRPAHVELLGWCSDEDVRQHYRHARALLFPGEEDFGIVPVEAFAHGCPVVAFGVGGATESVVRGLCGEWFEEPTVDSLADAIRRCGDLRFDPVAMHDEARRFGRARFLREMREILEDALERDTHQ